MIKIQCPRGEVLLDDADERILYGTMFDGSQFALTIYVDKRGYVQLRAGLHRLYLHRAVMNAAPHQIVDHIDNDNRLDCRKSNLRFATKSQNNFNRGKAKHNTSGFKGVSFCKDTGMWRAEITANRVKHKLGRFYTVEAAARAYDAAAPQYHGEFANLNFPCD